VSAHYLVGLDGRVTQFVEESDTAHHVGRVRHPTARLSDAEQESPNLYTIGIEFEDGGDPGGASRTDAQYRTGAALLERIAARWRIPLDREHVIGHREVFAAKDCPGNLDIERLIEAATAVRDRRHEPAGESRAAT
jgi:N-acetylmuramoyl-L-alanine amidase